VVLCIDNEPSILEGMETLLGGWGCRVLTAPDLKGALETIEAAEAPPGALLVDYHLDDGDGLMAIRALRMRFGEELPAILITADRSPRMRDEARAQNVQVLNKPLKPAALRALLAQWRARRLAAAE
jgi:CheY-like chemotaxis protein